MLDEPENSLAPKFQIDLLKLIVEASRYCDCQFVIATHSPFLLSIPGAKIYNLDLDPVEQCNWYELENVRIYYEFFKNNYPSYDMVWSQYTIDFPEETLNTYNINKKSILVNIENKIIAIQYLVNDTLNENEDVIKNFIKIMK